jgi:hypothetical protein
VAICFVWPLTVLSLQVEKAFREGTARQNAHSIFVCLALKLLEERVHVACKEIITLEKQVLVIMLFGNGLLGIN